MSLFETFVQQIAEASARIEGKTAVFYSGKDWNNEPNIQNARDCVARYPDRYYMIQDTEVGKILDEASRKQALGQISIPEYNALVSLASRKDAGRGQDGGAGAGYGGDGGDQDRDAADHRVCDVAALEVSARELEGTMTVLIGLLSRHSPRMQISILVNDCRFVSNLAGRQVAESLASGVLG